MACSMSRPVEADREADIEVDEDEQICAPYRNKAAFRLIQKNRQAFVNTLADLFKCWKGLSLLELISQVNSPTTLTKLTCLLEI